MSVQCRRSLLENRFPGMDRLMLVSPERRLGCSRKNIVDLLLKVWMCLIHFWHHMENRTSRQFRCQLSQWHLWLGSFYQLQGRSLPDQYLGHSLVLHRRFHILLLRRGILRQVFRLFRHHLLSSSSFPLSSSSAGTTRAEIFLGKWGQAIRQPQSE